MTQSASEVVAPLTGPKTRQQLTEVMPTFTSDSENKSRLDRTLEHMRSLLGSSVKLREADRTSLYSAIFYAISMGLEVLPIFGHCYFVPLSGKVALWMGYPGLMELVRRDGKISAFSATAVHEGDHFEYGLGTENRITHRPLNTGEARPLTHTYAVAFYSPTEWQFVVMERHEIETTKERSHGAKKLGTPWHTDFERMAIKTPIIRLCKQLPKKAELVAALQLDASLDMGITQGIPQLMLPPEARDTLADGTPRSEASLHEKMEDGAVKQTGKDLSKLRTEIESMGVRLLNTDTGGLDRLQSVLKSVGFTSLHEGMTSTDERALVNLADRLEATLAPAEATAVAAEAKAAATNTADAAPPAADDDIPY